MGIGSWMNKALLQHRLRARPASKLNLEWFEDCNLLIKSNRYSVNLPYQSLYVKNVKDKKSTFDPNNSVSFC
jgi:hypothetical protein